jgi:hypothetical protein
MKRKTTYNSTYKKLAVQWLNEAWSFVSSSLLAESFSLRNRQLLVAAKRCTQAEKRHSSNMITDLKMKKMENANPQKQEFSSPSLQASLRCKTHAFLPMQIFSSSFLIT